MLALINRSLTAVFVVGILSISAFGFQSAPEWLRQAARSPIPGYDKEVSSVVLYQEEAVTLDGSGKLVTVERQAARILQKEGIRDAVAQAFYLSRFSQIKDMQAWLIAPGGEVKELGKNYIVDRISDPDDIYDEGRIKIINASQEADIGYVFGYSFVKEDKPLFYQYQYFFQEDRPTLLSKFSITVPAGWKTSSLTFNRGNINPQVTGNTSTWELRDLPPIPYEPMSPSFVNLVPRVAVNYAPNDSGQSANKAFSDWLEVSQWATKLYDPQVIIDDNVAAKAQELTAGLTTEFEKIRAIGRFVQNLQYISIDIGVGHGNGMIPRSSTTVLSRGYGDCKDKANLMRALLRSVKIESYPVAIYSGDPSFVRKEWPSPRQFNHAIIAVAVSDKTESPTIAVHPKLGRLLFFDATDQFTPVGDLPDYLQGSNGLIIAGEKGDLFEMPLTPPEFNVWDRETNIALSADGSIKGVIKERIKGQESRGPRTMLRSISNDDFRRSIERWLTRGATAAKLDSFAPIDKQENAAFEMDISFSAPSYGQLMQNRLLVFKPAIANRASSVYLTEKTRKHPIEFESNSFNEKVVFDLPSGFVVDEMPEPVTISVPFGSYETTYEVKEGKLHYSRSMIMKRTLVPVEKYESIRQFFSKILDAEQTPVVLIRK